MNHIYTLSIFPAKLWNVADVAFNRRIGGRHGMTSTRWYTLTAKRLHRLTVALAHSDKIYQTYMDDLCELSIHAKRRKEADAPTAQDVIIIYTDVQGKETTRRITPLGLDVASDGAVLLRAFCHLRNEERSFRLDRIKMVQETEATEQHPDRLIDLLWEKTEHAGQYILWADSGNLTTILNVEGVANACAQEGINSYLVHLDPRYNSQAVRKNIQDAILRKGRQQHGLYS